MELTVAVCTYRRYQWLEKCLEALARQTLARNRFRVVVVDNSLQPEESARFRKSLPQGIDIEYIVTEKSGLSYARNVALEKCDTPYIAYLDDDALAAPDWADRLLATFRSQNGAAGVVGGKVRPIYETPKPEWLAGELLLGYLATLDWCQEPFDLQPNDGKWLVGANIAYLTRALRCAGGFPENLGRKENLLLCHEEFWINEAVRHQGLSIHYDPDVVVDHLVQTVRMTPKWLCENAFWEGVSWVLCQLATSQHDLVNAEYKQMLIASLSKQSTRIPRKPDTHAIEQACLAFKEAGFSAMKEIGLTYDPNAPAVTLTKPATNFIVTTCLNAAETIERTIESVITQSGDFYLRYHIQDAGSTDDTLAIVKEWQGKLEQHSDLIKCAGVYLSFNTCHDSGMYEGITNAFQKLQIPADAFMSWINADDILLPGAIATIAHVQKTFQNIEWITGQLCCIRELDGAVQSVVCGFPRWFIQRGLCETRYWQCIQQEGTFWRKRLWDQAGGLNTSLRLAGDFDLWRRFAEHAELWHFQGPLASFHRRAGQLSEDFGRYAREIDALVPKEQKDHDWQWASTALKDGSNPFTLSCLYYDWDSDSYKETYPPVWEFLPPWKKEFAPHANDFAAKAAASAAVPTAAPNGEANTLAQTPAHAGRAAVDDPPKPSAAPTLSPQQTPKPTRGPLRLLGWAKRLKRWRSRARDYRSLRASGLFCDAYYLRANPDVAMLGIDPLLHYLRHGWQEGRNPNPVFQSWYYLQHNPDVKTAGANPLLHFWSHGATEGRNPCETFNTARYLSCHPEVKQSGENPLAHYLRTAFLTELPCDPPLAPRIEPPPLPATPVPPPLPSGIATPPSRITPETFGDFTYSRKFHLPLLAPYAKEMYGREIASWEDEDLKVYQDLLVYAFIRQNIPVGSRILEIGGGTRTRVLNTLAREYECWNLDRFPEKPESGHFINPETGIHCVNDHLGAANPHLPENAFDVAFSISVFDSTNQSNEFPKKQQDIARVCKAVAPVLHASSMTLNTNGQTVFPAFFRWLAEQGRTRSPLPTHTELAETNDLYYLSETTYNRLWLPYTHLPYAALGRPISINLTCAPV